MTLPNGITQDMVDDAIESRDLMGEPFTPLGLKRFIGRLGRAYVEGLDVQDLVDKMIEGGEKGPWRTIYVNESSVMRKKRPQRHSTSQLTVVERSDKETAQKGLDSMRGAMRNE